MKTNENGENIYKMVKTSEAVAKRCSVKKVFFKILQNLLENICPETLFKVQAYSGTGASL